MKHHFVTLLCPLLAAPRSSAAVQAIRPQVPDATIAGLDHRNVQRHADRQRRHGRIRSPSTAPARCRPGSSASPTGTPRRPQPRHVERLGLPDHHQQTTPHAQHSVAGTAQINGPILRLGLRRRQADQRSRLHHRCDALLSSGPQSPVHGIRIHRPLVRTEDRGPLDLSRTSSRPRTGRPSPSPAGGCCRARRRADGFHA